MQPLSDESIPSNARRQSGIILLAEGRSGSSWLGQLTDATGVMGVSSEWLAPKLLGVDPRRTDARGYLDRVIAAATSENGRFALKIFPRHLLWFADQFGADFLSLCGQLHDVHLARLSRRDRLRQAISLVRAQQTGRWSSETSGGKRMATFDRAEIARAIHFLERSEAFWSAHEMITCKSPAKFIYEDLLRNPDPYLDWAATALKVDRKARAASGYEIQRDTETESWVTRFGEMSVDAGLDALTIEKKGARNKAKLLLRQLRNPSSVTTAFYRF